jgi:hypothetical protein
MVMLNKKAFDFALLFGLKIEDVSHNHQEQ